MENPAAKKKSAEKALIPLPPAGSVSFLFAKGAAVQISTLPKTAAGDLRRIAFSLSEKGCKEMKRRCAAAWLVQVEGVFSEAPVCKGMTLEKVTSIEFYFLNSSHKESFLAFFRRLPNWLKSPAQLAFKAFGAFQRWTESWGCDQPRAGVRARLVYDPKLHGAWQLRFRKPKSSNPYP